MFRRGAFLKNYANILLRNNYLVRSKYTNEGFEIKIFGSTFSKNSFHQSHLLECPTTKQIPLPVNLKDVASSEKLKFSPQRTRDINGSFISCSTSSTFNQSETINPVDDNIECYDCSGAINLSSSMQTNVPFPFLSKGKPIHLNMPGGQWGQKEKYVSEDLNNAHQTNISQFGRGSGPTFTLGGKTGTKNCHFRFPSKELYFLNSLFPTVHNLCNCQLRTFHSVKDRIQSDNVEVEKTSVLTALSKKDKLKAAIKDYGAVILVFHIGISLVSLGCFYALVASGVDLSVILKHFGAHEGAGAAGTAAHFVIAYALHKSLAPARITVTLTAAPFIVKKLRKIGILKTPAPKP